MVKSTQVTDGIAAFAENELLPQMDGVQLWAASAALILAYQKSEQLLASVLQKPAFSALGLTDENGMIDIDAACETAKATVKKRGKLEIKIPFIGKLKFDESDFDKLTEYIKKSEAR